MFYLPFVITALIVSTVALLVLLLSRDFRRIVPRSIVGRLGAALVLLLAYFGSVVFLSLGLFFITGPHC